MRPAIGAVLLIAGACAREQEPVADVAPPSLAAYEDAHMAAVDSALARSGLVLEYRWVDTAAATTATHRHPGTGEPLALEPTPVLGLADVDSVRIIPMSGVPPTAVVSVQLTFAAAQRFLSATSARRGQTLAVVVNGVVVQAPRIESPWGGGVPVAVDLPDAHAKDLHGRIAAAIAGR